MNKKDDSSISNNTKKENDVASIPSPEGPLFRSVAMMSTTPSPFLSGSSFQQQPFLHSNTVSSETKQSSPFVHDDSLTAVAPPKMTSMPGAQDRPAAPGPSSFVSRLQHHQPYVWILEPADVPSVPLYHPLERTATTLHDLPLATITQRISTYLRQANVQATYHSESRLGDATQFGFGNSNDSNNLIECVSPDLVKFGIQLWRDEDANAYEDEEKSTSSDDDDDNVMPVILEIQRRQGCCLAMQTIRHQLIQAILLEDEDAMMQDSKDNNPPTTTTCDVVRQLIETQVANKRPVPVLEDTAKTNTGTTDCLSTALDITKRLLSSERWDERRFGLDTLMVLCDASSSQMASSEDAMQVSKAILVDDVAVWQPLLFPFLAPDFVKETTVDDDMNSSMCLHLRVLQILAHALETASSGGLDWMSSASPSFWRDHVLPHAWKNAYSATTRPLLAAWSIRVLNQLTPPTVTATRGQEKEALLQAHRHGCYYHHSLEVETERLLTRMEE